MKAGRSQGQRHARRRSVRHVQGQSLPLAGTAVKVGALLPPATVGGGLHPVNIAEVKGKVRIINVVPSLDTPVCDAETHELVEKDPALAENIELVTVEHGPAVCPGTLGARNQSQEHDLLVTTAEPRSASTTGC